MATSRAFLSILFGSTLCRAANVFLCGQYDTHTSSSSPYIFSTNEWGEDGSGSQCISVSDTVFTATWEWKDNPDLVHAFPNIKLESDLLPIQLSNLSALNIAVTWSMTAEDGQDLATVDAGADVVVDMFLDPDPVSANSTTLPKYEVMVWMGAYGGKKPIGFNSTVENLPTYSLNGTNFTLYTGPNGNGQTVYSWLAPSNITNFNTDISPLIHYLWRHNMFAESNYLGTVQFGTEAFHATSNVTFSAKNFNLNITEGKPKPVPGSGSGSGSKSGGDARATPNLLSILLLGFFGFLVSL